METVKEITKYIKLFSAEEQKVLLKELKTAWILKEAERIDKSTTEHQKKNNLKPLKMKEIVDIVNKVRADLKRKHAA